MVTNEQIKHIADLAHLSFSDEELKQYTKDMNEIVDFANQLDEIDTGDVEVTTSILNEYNIVREDIVKESFDRDLLLQNAPESQDGMFKIPKVLD